jgi:hypothetical protein
MNVITHTTNERDTVFVPVVSLEEMPRLTDDERAHLIAELDRTEADMTAGNFEVYSPEWLDKKFRAAMARA